MPTAVTNFMRVLISIPVHECRRVIEDQLRNLTYFFEDSVIVLHVSQSYKESLDFSAFPNVVVNPQRHASRWGNIVYLHYSNIEHALSQNIKFDYAVFCSSNELYFRKGVEEYLATADAFMDPRGFFDKEGNFAYGPERSVFYMRTALVNPALTDEKLWTFVEKNGLPGPLKSQIEGSAYSHAVMADIMKILKEEFTFEYMSQVSYCAEEILLPTVALAVVKRRNARVARQFSFMDWCHDFTPRLWISSIKYWRGERKDRWLTHYFETIDAQKSVFAIKGVKRTYFNKVRNHMRSLGYGVSLTSQQVREYAKQDLDYNLRLWKKEIAPSRLALNTAHSVLGVGSRAIGKPKGYLKHKLRDRALAFLQKYRIKVG
jgi:hypothetical protein